MLTKGRPAFRHFVAIGVAGALYAVGTICNVIAADLHGGWMPTGSETAPLYWLGDRFAVVGAHAGFTKWASAGDFLVWAGELMVALTWARWAVEIIRAKRLHWR